MIDEEADAQATISGVRCIRNIWWGVITLIVEATSYRKAEAKACDIGIDVTDVLPAD